MYRCNVCSTVVPAGKSLLRHFVYQPGTRQIAREIPVCEPCHTYLSNGVPEPILRRQGGKPIEVAASRNPNAKRVAVKV